VVVPPELDAGIAEPSRHRIEVVDEERGMRLASGSEPLLDTDMELIAFTTEPGPTPGSEHRRLVDLGETEQPAVDRAPLALAPRRAAHLDVMECGHWCPSWR